MDKLKQEYQQIFTSFRINDSKQQDEGKLTPFGPVNLSSARKSIQTHINNMKEMLKMYQQFYTGKKETEYPAVDENLRNILKTMKTCKKTKSQRIELQNCIQESIIKLKEQEARYGKGGSHVQIDPPAIIEKYFRKIALEMNKIRHKEDMDFTVVRDTFPEPDGVSRQFVALANNVFLCEVKWNEDGSFHSVQLTEHTNTGEVVDNEINKDLEDMIQKGQFEMFEKNLLEMLKQRNFHKIYGTYASMKQLEDDLLKKHQMEAQALQNNQEALIFQGNGLIQKKCGSIIITYYKTKCYHAKQIGKECE